MKKLSPQEANELIKKHWREKAEAREKDFADIESGRRTLEEVVRENAKFNFPNIRIHPPKNKNW